MGQVGAGRIGKYSSCSFSSKGVGRFVPEEDAHPASGQISQMNLIQEERIEAVCDRAILNDVIKAIRKVHPYEEMALDVYPLEEIMLG